MLTKMDRLQMLDAEFDSPINRATGAMKLDEYERRRREIEAMPPDQAPEKPAPAPRPAGLTDEQFAMLARALGVAIREHVAAKIAPLETRMASLADAGRVAELQARVAELEAKLAEPEAVRRLRAV
jgi:hypothetical protein